MCNFARIRYSCGHLGGMENSSSDYVFQECGNDAIGGRTCSITREGFHQVDGVCFECLPVMIGWNLDKYEALLRKGLVAVGSMDLSSGGDASDGSGGGDAADGDTSEDSSTGYKHKIRSGRGSISSLTSPLQLFDRDDNNRLYIFRASYSAAWLEWWASTPGYHHTRSLGACQLLEAEAWDSHSTHPTTTTATTKEEVVAALIHWFKACATFEGNPRLKCRFCARSIQHPYARPHASWSYVAAHLDGVKCKALQIQQGLLDVTASYRSARDLLVRHKSGKSGSCSASGSEGDGVGKKKKAKDSKGAGTQ